MYQQPPVRQTTLRPIVRPGASPFARVWDLHEMSIVTAVWVIVGLVAVLALTFGLGLTLGPYAVVALLAPLFAGGGAALHAGSKDVVTGPGWTFRGKPIDGQAFQLLEDIDARFAYAETHIRELPTGISWPEVDADVRALLWEAAEQGAEITALDAEIHELRYAEDGTPGAALKRSLEEQRAARWQIMRGIQWEAELLARTAGNAVAAARVALAKTGSLAALRGITTSREAIVAAGALAEARNRLEQLAEVWSELDETGTIAAEKLEADQRKQLPS